MTNDEIKNLVRVSDCFISLHRSEGFGRGLAEAMYFGVPVIGTAWSGNMDFMTPEASFLIDYDLVPVREGEYPHWADHEWAEARREQAVDHLVALIDDPRLGIVLGRAAGIHIRKILLAPGTGRSLLAAHRGNRATTHRARVEGLGWQIGGPPPGAGAARLTRKRSTAKGHRESQAGRSEARLAAPFNFWCSPPPQREENDARIVLATRRGRFDRGVVRRFSREVSCAGSSHQRLHCNQKRAAEIGLRRSHRGVPRF
jgi:hypothetical protein